jgi:hypothetical protein
MIEALQIQKEQAISDNLPAWVEVEKEISNATTIVALRAIILKLARVIYWLAKNKGD